MAKVRVCGGCGKAQVKQDMKAGRCVVCRAAAEDRAEAAVEAAAKRLRALRGR